MLAVSVGGKKIMSDMSTVSFSSLIKAARLMDLGMHVFVIKHSKLVLECNIFNMVETYKPMNYETQEYFP